MAVLDTAAAVGLNTAMMNIGALEMQWPENMDVNAEPSDRKETGTVAGMTHAQMLDDTEIRKQSAKGSVRCGHILYHQNSDNRLC